jgi:glycosyltransferase involved in cell wall biosynthesis
MKIAMIGQKGIPSRAGGIEIHVEELSKRLVSLGYEVEVYCRKGLCDKVFEDNKYCGISIKYTPSIRLKHLEAITHTLTSTIRALFSHSDIFHYHALGPSALAFLPRLFGKKVVCTVHGLDWQRKKWGSLAKKFLLFGEYCTARLAHKTINVSKNAVSYYKDKYNADTFYIPNGIERPDPVNPGIIKEKYGLDRDSYILYLGRLVPEKGIHYLIDAYKSINTEKKLVIAGGTSHTNEYGKELQCKAAGCKNIILTGFVRDQELAELYSNAYFYVLPSEVEGLPISLLEAMSYGNCCLVSDIPENTDVIGSMGYSFANADAADLARKLSMLLRDGNKVLKVRQFSADYILNKYNWDEIALKTDQIYRLLGGKKILKAVSPEYYK